MLSRYFGVLLALVWSVASWSSISGCSSFVDDLRETIAEGNLDGAIAAGEERLRIPDRESPEDRKKIDRVVAEAYLLRARRTDSIEAYRAIRSRVSISPELTARVWELEARAHYRDVAMVEDTVESYRNHRAEYPESPFTSDSRKREIGAALSKAGADNSVDGYKTFRQEYAEWTEFKQELDTALEREGELALDEAVGSGRLDRIRSV